GYKNWKKKLKEIEFDHIDAFENQIFDKGWEIKKELHANTKVVLD
ncbi:37052_t:CDS:1, partial [Gigaspora margarita]